MSQKRKRTFCDKEWRLLTPISKGVPFELLKKATTFHQNTLLSCELSDNVLISEYSCAKVFIGNRLSKGTPFVITFVKCQNNSITTLRYHYNLHKKCGYVLIEMPESELLLESIYQE